MYYLLTMPTKYKIITQLIFLKPTLEEQEKIDEEKLLKELEVMNETFKNNKKQNIMDALSELYNKESLNSPNSKNDSLGSTNTGSAYITSTVQDSSTDKFLIPEGKENLIIQNLKISDEVLKFIIIGDKSVGKSYLIRKLCDMTNMVYSPTRRYIILT